MKIYLTNSLSHSKEEFIPIDEREVRMYACGPTVYDRPHLGNARATVVFDILHRLLKVVYPKVTFVRNITDVDDKIIKAAKETKQSIQDLTRHMTQYYHDDIAALNCLRPTAEPRATEHIEEMIEMIQTLIEKGHAYEAEGHVLFSIESYDDYGKLSRRSMEDMIAGARVEIAPYKKDPGDFVLWKPAIGEEHDTGFDSPWGRGRPGWHIECSAMSKKLLGDEFDIHAGGADLTFPHHENEIAQSACANEKPGFAKYWVHNGFLTVHSEKMSKSLGNFKTVREALEDGIEGVVIRYLYLTTHYKKPLDFNDKGLDDAKKAVDKFRLALSKHKVQASEDKELVTSLADDMNTPAVLAKLHELASEAIKGDEVAASKLQFGCDLLGLNLAEEKKDIDPKAIEFAEARLKAKQAKDWVEADRLRDEITKLGYTVKDSADGYELSKI